jgi:hypothetical protein
VTLTLARVVSRLKARNSLPVNGCVAGLRFLSIRTCRIACSRSIWSQRRSTSSDARRPCLKAIKTIVESRCPQRLPFMASIRRSTSRSVRCSRDRYSALGLRQGQSGGRRSHCELFVVRGYQSQVRSGGHFHLLRRANCAFNEPSSRSLRRFDVDLAVRYVTGCVATRRKAVGSTSIAARPSFFQTTTRSSR